tara:strand:- start:397 stop:1056 length:660 start_codon:yes stop_codon:yes gene_type:complete
MLGTSGNRAVDILITYRLLRILTTPFEKQDAFKYGIVDKNGKVLRKYNTLKDTKEKKAYTWLHRFCFNLKRIMSKAGLGGRLGSIALSLAVLLKEHNDPDLLGTEDDANFLKAKERMGISQYPELEKYKSLFESTIVQWIKMEGKWDEIVKEDANLPPIVDIKDTELSESANASLYNTFFGIDVYKVDNEFVPNELITYRSQDIFRSLVWAGDDKYEVI